MKDAFWGDSLGRNRQGEGNNGWWGTQKPATVGTHQPCLGLFGPGETTEVLGLRHSRNRGGGDAQREGQTYGQTWSTGTKKEVMKKYPDPSFLPSNLLPEPPLARPNGKAVDGAVSREQHPRTEQPRKDGEWMGEGTWSTAGKTSISTFWMPPWETLAHLGWDVHKKTYTKDPLILSILVKR